MSNAEFDELASRAPIPVEPDAEVPMPLDSAQWSVQDTWRFVQRIAQTDFVPKGLRGNPASVLACVMTGRELDLPPMTALQQIYIVDGRPALSAQQMRALIQSRGHRIEIDEASDEKVILHGTRADGSDAHAAWSMADAQRAGLTTKTNWKNYPRAMLLARATSELARMLFADCLGPIRYTPEELGEGEHGD